MCPVQVHVKLTNLCSQMLPNSSSGRRRGPVEGEGLRMSKTHFLLLSSPVLEVDEP